MFVAFRIPRASHLRATALLLGLPLLLNSSLAAAPPLRPLLPQPSERDVQLGVYARRALMSDARLGPLNLGVSVRQGVATLWGPVPSIALEKEAIERLRPIQGLIAIHSELYVTPGEEPAIEKLPEPLQDPRAPGALAARLSVREPLPPLSVTESLSLPPPSVSLSRPAIELPPDASPPLLLHIEQLRQSDPRFRLLKPQLQGGVVYLYGMAARWEDVHDLTRLLTALPGVDRVTLRNLQIDPRLESLK